MWIDLTNTERFYDPESEVRAKGIKYVKLSCKGREETPTEKQTIEFIHICKVFIRDHPNDLIAVHCTHGFNRTGFLICSFLVEEDNWAIEVAIQAFATSRPPGIYKSDYLKELIRRYDEGEPVPDPPPRPDWCFEEEEDDNANEGSVNGHHQASDPGENHTSGCHNSAVFMEGVSGVIPVRNGEERQRLMNEIHRMTGWQGRRDNTFPGAQPVSMTLQNLLLLKQFPYRVSWKADGTRYMMYIRDRDQIFFLDRKSDFFKVEKVTFPRRGKPNDVINGTLLDGEMVIDEDAHGRKRPRYLIYDIVCFPGTQIGQCDFDQRFKCIKEQIIDPRTEAFASGRIDPSRESFGIRRKDFWEIIGAKKILSPQFKVGHETDGLIFQPVPDPYQLGTCETILKWKPHTLNSIDFRLKIIQTNAPGCVREKVAQFWVIGLDRPFFQIPLRGIKDPVVRDELRNYNNKLVECVWDIGWFKVIRERTDKDKPNSVTTAEKVMKSITHPVTKEHLFKVIDEVVGRQQSTERPGDVGHSSGSESHDKSIMPPPKRLKS